MVNWPSRPADSVRDHNNLWSMGRLHSQGRSVSVGRQAGFTLLEIMVVVVVIGLSAGIVMLGIGSSDLRQQRQAAEQLQQQLQQIQMTALMQNRILGIQPVEGDSPAYQVVEAQAATIAAISSASPSNPTVAAPLSGPSPSSGGMGGPAQALPIRWQAAAGFARQRLPEQTRLVIEPLSLSNQPSSRSWPPDWPDAVWFGAAQARPVRIFLSDQDSQPVLPPVTITMTGQIAGIDPDDQMAPVGPGQ